MLTTSLYKNRRGKSSKQSWRHTSKELASGLKQAQTMMIIPNEKESMSRLGGQEKMEDHGQMLEAQDEQKQVYSMAQ